MTLKILRNGWYRVETAQRELTVYQEHDGTWTVELWRGYDYVYPKSFYKGYKTAWQAIRDNLHRLQPVSIIDLYGILLRYC